jgi:hypothetical protein
MFIRLRVETRDSGLSQLIVTIKVFRFIDLGI